MKKAIIVILALALAISALLIAGCSSEDTQTPSESKEMQAKEDSEDMQTKEEDLDETENSEMPEEDMGPFVYVDVTPAEAQQLIAENPNLIIIDVSPHYAEGHLPGAVSYPLDNGSLDRALPTLDKNATYLVYCHVDSVAIAGAQKLIDAGFKNVYRLEGNYSAWVNAGYPVER